MTILYTQLLSIPDRHILCNAFTLHGQSLIPNKRILLALKSALTKVQDELTDKIYKHEENDHIFYIKVTNIIICVITDRITTLSMINTYINLILTKYEDLNEDVLEEEGNKFNMRHDYEEVDEELSVTKKICVDNLTHLVQRGETINKLEEMGAKLKNASVGLSRSSRNMYYGEMYKKYMVYGVVVIVVILVWIVFFK